MALRGAGGESVTKTPDQMEELLEPAPAHIHGPTWRKWKSGGFCLPEYTLGDQVINWVFQYVKQPSGKYAGQPFVPTDEQFRFLLWWYAIDEDGKFVYRSSVFRRLKGAGKDPLAAVISLAEMCGPVLFGEWDSDGKPVAVPRRGTQVQVAATASSQTSNAFRLFPGMISEALKTEHKLEVNKFSIFGEAGAVIEAVTSSPSSMEGKRPNLVIQDEIQLWLENNGGHEMKGVIDGNVTKASDGDCRLLSICNAHRPGEESVGEHEWEHYQQVLGGSAVSTRKMYDALEAPADTPLSELHYLINDPESYQEALQRLREGIEIAKGDAWWLDTDVIVESILNGDGTGNDNTESRRKYLNQINAVEDGWIAPFEWDAISDTNVKLKKKDRITLGFDGSKGKDHTALVACRVEDGALFPIKVWDPEKYDGEVPREHVDKMVAWCFGQYNVAAFRADVREFEAYIDQWAVEYGRKLKIRATSKHTVGFDMRSNQKQFTLDCEKFEDAVLEREITHDGSSLLRQHVINAHRRPNNHGVSIGKASKDSSKKIDAAVCAVLAYGARQELLMSKKNRGSGAAVFKGF